MPPLVATSGLGGASGHISSNLTKLCEIGIEKRITRVAVSATTAVASDASAQELNMVVRNQEEYDLNRTLTCSAASAITTAAQEGTKNAGYRTNGRKDNMHHKRSNEKAIEKNVPSRQQQNVKNACEKLSQIPEEKLAKELEKTIEYTKWREDKVTYQSEMKPYKERIGHAKHNHQMASCNEDFARAKLYEEQANILTQEKKTISDKFNSYLQTVKKADIAIMNQDNVHFLTGDKVGQVAVDFKAPDTNTRGTNRATFDYHVADDESTVSIQWLYRQTRL